MQDHYAIYFNTVSQEKRPITGEASVRRDNIDTKKGLVVAMKLKSIELKSMILKREKNRKVMYFVKPKKQTSRSAVLTFKLKFQYYNTSF